MEQDVVRIIAFRIYEDRMRRKVPGSELNDWLMAEKEFNACYRPREAYIKYQEESS